MENANPERQNAALNLPARAQTDDAVAALVAGDYWAAGLRADQFGCQYFTGALRIMTLSRPC
jgi:hypothetical protein